MNRNQKKAFFIALPLGLLMLAGFYMALFSPTPAAKIYKPWIPQGARILNAENVQPGTFKVAVSKEEMVKRTTGAEAALRVVVTDKNHHAHGSGHPSGVEYWLPDQGIFDYSWDNVPIPFDWFSWAVVFDPKNNVFNLFPNRSWGTIFFTGIMAMICAFVAIESWRKILLPGP